MMAENCLRRKSSYTLAPSQKKACSPGERARSLGWIRTLACEAGDLGFKSQRARHHLGQVPRKLELFQVQILS